MTKLKKRKYSPKISTKNTTTLNKSTLNDLRFLYKITAIKLAIIDNIENVMLSRVVKNIDNNAMIPRIYEIRITPELSPL